MTSLFKQKRILLVDGYIRHHEKILKLSHIIPASINFIIYEYQLSIERWSKKWSNSNLNIVDDNMIAKMKFNKDEKRCFTVYGEHIVKYGENFIWNLEIISGVNLALYIGLIPNENEVLIESQSDCMWHEKCGYVWWSGLGWFLSKNTLNEEYSDVRSFANKGDILQIRFNWKQNSLSYIANGKDFGNALYEKKLTTDEKAEFRFAVCFNPKQCKSLDVAIKIDCDTT